MAQQQPAEPLVARPAQGRQFTGVRRVMLGDVDPGGRMRLDALARFLQDVSNDDVDDAGYADNLAWVARRVTIDVVRFPAYREQLEMTTWCGGLGGRWAERRVSILGAGGARVEAATLWVHVDLTGAPVPLSAELVERLSPAAGGRKVSARLRLGPPPAEPPWPLEPWFVRRADLDLLGHVNNAAAWAMVEEDLGDVVAAPRPAGLRCELEFPREVTVGDEVAVSRTTDLHTGVRSWWLLGSAGVHLAARVGPGPGVLDSDLDADLEAHQEMS